MAVACLGTEINEYLCFCHERKNIYVFAMKERIKTTSKLMANINDDWET